MTAAEAHATAAAEGLALIRAENPTGFKGVSRRSATTIKPFLAQLTQGGRPNYLGAFVTAEEAALAVARFLGPEGVAAELAPTEPEPTPMTAAEVHAAAAAEGLTLMRAENATGFKGVFGANNASNPFQAQLRLGGGDKYLGMFATSPADANIRRSSRCRAPRAPSGPSSGS